MTDTEAITAITRHLGIEEGDAGKILEKAYTGGEISESCDTETWWTERFRPSCVQIDEVGYSRMCVDALKILGGTAPTDYGSSRQRDLGQLWADMTRGYLGELAFIQFLRERWGVNAELGHEVGNLRDYLPLDIHQIQKPGEEARTPREGVSIKTTKWNGIWLDIPGDQFNHSDIHTLVKVGAGRDHLFAFFKSISVFRDKILQRGQEVGAITAEEAVDVFDALPSFRPISAYISGFVLKNADYVRHSYGGVLRTRNYTVYSWNGPVEPGDVELIKARESVPGKVRFEGIGEFSHERMYLFNVGNLKWRDEDWRRVVDSL